MESTSGLAKGDPIHTLGKIIEASERSVPRRREDPEPAITLEIDPKPSKDSKFAIDLFIETNINYGTDGGLYAELIANRAFQEPETNSTDPSLGKGTLKYWSPTSSGTKLNLTKSNPLSNALPQSVTISGDGERCGIKNTGWFGIPIDDQEYQLSFQVRSASGGGKSDQEITFGLYSSDMATTFAEGSDKVTLTSEWQEKRYTLNPRGKAGNADNVFALQVPCQGSDVQVNLVSLFPPTWEGTVARRDLAQALADIKPELVRLPGGNDLEGNSIAARFQWRNSVGPLKDRPGRLGTWAGWNTEGLGLMELFDIVEKMGASPILSIYAGYSLDRQAVPEDELQPYVQDALDQLHFLLDESGEWAELRASFGRKEPYSFLKLVEIGNEDWINNAPDTWPYRYPAFRDAIAKEFPQLGQIASSPYNFTGQPAIDQHDYNTPDYFFTQFDRMDSWPRNGTKIYGLEYAVINGGNQESGDIYGGPDRLKHSTMNGALGEAVFTMGMERNGDLCYGAAYAPIFMNEAPGAQQWSPDLLTFDNLNLVKSASYHIHQVNPSSKPETSRVFHSVGTDSQGWYVIKLANVADHASKVVLEFGGGGEGGPKFSSSQATLWQISADGREVANTLSNPDVISPTTSNLPPSSFSQDGSQLTLDLPSLSFSIIRVPTI
ncbi:glycoside hydrolase [Violaceomyces palustris]|uniref:Glycoside hydrolase n=1 Tax=Violaceomyces palustris TaxID=1673888 RepID=A0ACD0NXQ7_9BASI|nr:glycoside hydrolase [Violaceomyces palustris]